MSTYFSEQQPKLPASLDIYTDDSVQKCPLGTKIELADGRMFVYSYNSSAAILPIATLCQQAVPISGHLTLAVPTAAAVDETHLHVTLQTTGVTLNQYREGFAVIDTPVGSAGGGTIYKIKSHPLQATVTGALQIELYDKIRIATTTASKVTLRYHPNDQVITSPASGHTGVDVGVTTHAVAVSVYTWLQVKGPCSVLINGTVVIGGAVIKDAAAAGSVAPNSETTFLPHIGTVMSVPADDLYALINLNIPGY